MSEKQSLWKIFTAGIIRENPVLRLVLGCCSALAVTTTVSGAIVGTSYTLENFSELWGLMTLFAFVAVALLVLSVEKRPEDPPVGLDEVEAALDDSNLSKLLDAIDVLRKSTQLLVVSHQRRTMEDADVLYGVSMQADGVSRVVSQKLDRATGKVVNA